MCGISGIVAPNIQHYKPELQVMTQGLKHRGPDAQGMYLFKNCGLGHRRLSIIDLETGQQPMLTPDETLGIVFNGEIYGYQDIRSACSYPFQTTSDTEVILALYRLYGCDFLSKLPGMFAFALWDEQEQTLVCARDRFGEKPFYYAIGKNGEFLFASEIKSIIASGLIEPILDTSALTFYLQSYYIHPHKTVYKNIFVLPPAHTLRYKQGQVNVERYWALPQLNDEISLPEAEQEFKRLLDAAVRKQLIADVPVGAFLSGGLDSSTIVAYAINHEADLKTFSFGFDGAIVDEIPYARDVAKYYQTDHTEFFDANTDIGELLLTMQQVYDDPFADSSHIPTYLISKHAKEHVKVVLTGDGGDELLAGYSWYKPLYDMENLNTGKLYFYRVLMRLLNLSSKLNHRLSPSLGPIRRAMQLKRQYPSIATAHFKSRQTFSDDELRQLGLMEKSLNGSYTSQYSSNTIDDALRMDIESYLVGDILVKIDRASMAHGLELRAPFLDVDFASFCIALPTRLKITQQSDKYLLRQACSGLWPDSLQNRPKYGFGGPIHMWLTRDSVKSLIHNYFDNSKCKLYTLLDYAQCQRMANQNIMQKWTLLNLSLWMENHQFSLA